MNSLFGLLGTMSSSVLANQAGLDVTGNNVANVNTPGYVEETAEIQTEATLPGESGGVNVAGIQRNFDTFTFGQVLQETGSQGAWNSQSEALGEAQGVIAPKGGGDIGSEMIAFFGQLTQMSANPSDIANRSQVLSLASQLAQSISSTSTGLSTQQASMVNQAQGAAGELNTNLSQIAQLNQQIAVAQADGDQAPDLRNQRDALVTNVSQTIGAQVITDPSGSITLMAAGTPLVSGNVAATVNVGTDSSGNMQVTVARDGDAPVDVTSDVTQGSIGGLLAASTAVSGSMTQLDSFAANLSTAVNGAQAKGYDLNGNSGQPIFTPPPANTAGFAAQFAVSSGITAQGIAASSTATGVPGDGDNASAMADVLNQSIGSITPGGQSLSAAASYAAISAGIGSAASTANTESTTATDRLTTAQNLNSSASGVNLNQEQVTLSQFQQGFQASTQVIQVTNTLLNDLMTMMQSVA